MMNTSAISTADPESAPAETPGQMTDEQIFKAIDLNTARSVQRFIPIQDGKGQMQSIPKSIRVSDYNPSALIDNMRSFRKMTKTEQDEADKKSRKWTADNNGMFKDRKQHLEKLQQELRDGKKKWDDVAKTSGRRKTPVETPFPSSVSPAAGNLASSTSPMVPNALFESTPAGGAPVVLDPLAAETTEEVENTSPNVHVGLASSATARLEKAGEALHNRRHDNRRKLGDPATSIAQQNDAKANTAVDNLLSAFAIAADTCYFPGRPEGAPRRSFALVVVDEVNQSSADGGHMSGRTVARKKTKVTVVGRNVEEVSFSIQSYRAASKHTIPPEGYERKELFHRPQQDKDWKNKALVPLVRTFEENRKNARKQPSKTSRTAAEVIADAHAQRSA
jgi:hypothetical protein